MSFDVTRESNFQRDIIQQMLAQGWQLGSGVGYDRENALYTADLLRFIQSSQADEWKKFCQTYPNDSERHFIEALVVQLAKASINATDSASRSYGTLGVLRHGLTIRNARFKLCQFKPEHNLNADTLARYQQNICRVVPELVYSPYANKAELETTGKQAKKWRIDLVLFINGLPVSTLELKSEFKQSVSDAFLQYK